MQVEIENINLTKLETIARKVFCHRLQDVKENIYSSICAELFIIGDDVSFQDIETLISYRIKTTIISKKSTGFAIHIRNMWKDEQIITKWNKQS